MMPSRIFVSSVTTDLEEMRDSVTAALQKTNYDVIEQKKTLRSNGGTMLETLRGAIQRADAAIFLCGSHAGYTPGATDEKDHEALSTFQQFCQDSGATSASYTQWEFLFAWARRIPCYVFFDKRATAGAREEDPAQKRNDQDRYKTWLRNIGVVRDSFENEQALREMVHQIVGNRERRAPRTRARDAAKAREDLPGAGALSNPDLFFGRDDEIRAIDERLFTHSFACIVGGSGSGKTSLLQAGVLPGWNIPGFRHVPCFTMRPNGDPFLALANLFSDIDSSADLLARELREDPEQFFHTHVKYCKSKDFRSVLIAIEQFEELFAPTQDEETVKTFIKLIVDSLRDRNFAEGADVKASPTFAVTIRVDFLQRCLEYSSFRDLLQKGIVLTAEPTKKEVTNIVHSIAEVIGLDVSGLVTQLADDTDELQSGRLVMLGYLMRRLDRERHPDHGGVTVQRYKELGGVKEAIGRAADRAFDNMGWEPDRKKAVQQRLFAALVQVDTNGRLLRRRARRAQFENDADVLRLVDLLSHPDTALLTKEQDTIEVTHEILFEHYEAFKTWIDENMEELVIAANVEKAAMTWDQAGEHPDFLWSSHKLGETLRRLATGQSVEATLSPLARRFLDPRRLLDALERELKNEATALPRRLEIGQTLSASPGGDKRAGVANLDDGTPDLRWQLVKANPEVRLPIVEEYWAPGRVEPFWVSVYPVTCAQFRSFMADEDYSSDAWWGEVEMPRRVRPELTLPGSCPAASLTWHHAMAFARWLDGRRRRLRTSGPDVPSDWHVRLPTEWEWLQAATGGDARPYPWGKDAEAFRARPAAEATMGGALIPVGLFPLGASNAGALDMVGNALEWTLNPFDGEPDSDHVNRALRGGRLVLNRREACAYRKKLTQVAATHDSGFRLVLASGDDVSLARLWQKG